MKRTITMFVLLFLTGCASDRFILVDSDTGAHLGPFVYRSGTEISVSNATFRLVKVVSRDRAAEDTLKSVVLSQFCVVEQSIGSVLSECKSALKHHWLMTSCRTPYINFRIAVSEEAEEKLQPITFMFVRDISVYEVLRTSADLAGLEFSIENGHVWLRERK